MEILNNVDVFSSRRIRPLMDDEIVVSLLRPKDLNDQGRRQIFMETLSDEERQRLALFHFERDRDLFLAAHGLLRVTLSRFENVEPRDWEFQRGAFGKPEIRAPESRLRCSISHTHGLAGCAVTRERDVGLDVEDLSAGAPLELAERFFSPVEALDLRRTPPERRVACFLTYWTLKEAYIKARGLGLSQRFDEFSFYKDSAGAWRIAFESPLPDDPRSWRFWSWHVGDSHLAALAIAGDLNGRPINEPLRLACPELSD